MSRYIAVVHAEGFDVTSFDFTATSQQGAGSRSRLLALRHFGRPDFVTLGLRAIPDDATDEDVERMVAETVAS